MRAAPSYESLLAFLERIEHLELYQQLEKRPECFHDWKNKSEAKWKELFGIAGVDVYYHLHPVDLVRYKNSGNTIENPHEYLTEGGSCAPAGTSKQPTQDLTIDSASIALLKFWTASKNYSNPIKENTVVQLPENVYILGNEIIGSSIYIRPCYPKLLKESLSIVESLETRHLIILGNPGIGKTYFGYYYLLSLARSGETVIYENHHEWLFLLTPHGVFRGTRYTFHNHLMSSNTFYIADGITPVDVPAKTILITELRRDIWHRFSKNSCDIRYMPVWSREELYSCRSMLYSSIPEGLVENLYLKWGGNPRYVLYYALVEAQQHLLREALCIYNIDSRVESVGGSGAKSDLSSLLIHRSVRDGFHSGPYQFASAHVVDEIYKRLYANHRDHLLRFISANQETDLCGQLGRQLYERHAHTIIAKGGVFKIRDLHTKVESTLCIPTDLTVCLYSNKSQFQISNNCYFRPFNIFESVDSFIKPNRLFRIVGAGECSCNETGIREALDILGDPMNPEMYYVVPPDRFAAFANQWHGSYGKLESQLGISDGVVGKLESQPGIQATVKGVCQFVMTYGTC